MRSLVCVKFSHLEFDTKTTSGIEKDWHVKFIGCYNAHASVYGEAATL